MVIRIVIKTRTTAKDDVSRELRAQLKKALDEMDVKLPSLSAVVLTGFDSAASVAGAKPPRTRPTPAVAEQKPLKGRKARAAAKRQAAAVPDPNAIRITPAVEARLPRPTAPKTTAAKDAATKPSAPRTRTPKPPAADDTGTTPDSPTTKPPAE
jgi:small conductance mechanosensitive channel